MEFAPGGDMFEYVVKKNGLREDEARWFFQQLIVGLDYCHKMVRGSTCVGGWQATGQGVRGGWFVHLVPRAAGGGACTDTHTHRAW